MRPLIEFLDHGNEKSISIFQYLYFLRSGAEGKFESALIYGKHNICIIGNPGMGKTCFINYMFIELKKISNLHPIILDYTQIASSDRSKAMMTNFIKEARTYFHEIGRPIKLAQPTDLSNCEDHSLEIQRHLKSIPKEYIERTKKMIIFIDDLDYAENDYVTILENYFLPYAQSDKLNIIIAVRPPLFNNINGISILKKHYIIDPRTIKLADDDLELIITNRLKSVLKSEEIRIQESNLFLRKITDVVKFIRAMKEPDLDDEILNQLKRNNPNINPDTIELPFETDFYNKLNNITFSNFREIEQLLPEMFQYQIDSIKNNDKNKDLNKYFYNNFIRIAINKEHILHDLVTGKTRNKNKKYDGNSILQNVLEYFKEEQVVGEYFYDEMKRFGITKNEADTAIKILSEKMSMIIPDFGYLLGNISVQERYKITDKGIQYTVPQWPFCDIHLRVIIAIVTLISSHQYGKNNIFSQTECW